MHDGYGSVTVHQQSPGLVLTALVVCYHSFLSQSIAILELRRVMRDWVALFTYFLGIETFSSFTKVFWVAEPENHGPGLANLIRFSRLLNSKPSWVLTYLYNAKIT